MEIISANVKEDLKRVILLHDPPESLVSAMRSSTKTLQLTDLPYISFTIYFIYHIFHLPYISYSFTYLIVLPHEFHVGVAALSPVYCC